MQAGPGKPLPRKPASGLLLMACLIATACSPTPTTEAALTSQPAIRTTAEVLSRPALRAEDVSLYPNPSQGAWCLGGLIRNVSASTLQEITIDLTIRTAHSAPVRVTWRVRWTYLQPGQAAPFEVPLGGEEPRDVDVELKAGTGWVLGRTPVVTQDVRLVQDGLRQQHVLGWAANTGQQAADVRYVLAVARDAGGAIVDVAPVGEGGFRLAAGERRPFVARLDTRQPVASVQVYFDAAPAEAAIRVPVAEVVQSEIRLSPNGLPYWVGLIRNDDPSWLWVSGVASVSAQGELVGAADIWLPVPIMPGESLAFALADVPGVEGWVREGGDPAALQVQHWLDTRRLPEEQAVQQLDLRVQSLETIGGTLFLRGLVRLPTDVAVERASVVAAVRDTLGNLVTAGAVELAAGSGPGTAAGFLLALPLPAGVQLAGLEYDVRAVAVR